MVDPKSASIDANKTAAIGLFALIPFPPIVFLNGSRGAGRATSSRTRDQLVQYTRDRYTRPRAEVEAAYNRHTTKHRFQ